MELVIAEHITPAARVDEAPHQLEGPAIVGPPVDDVPRDPQLELVAEARTGASHELRELLGAALDVAHEDPLRQRGRARHGWATHRFESRPTPAISLSTSSPGFK